MTEPVDLECVNLGYDNVGEEDGKGSPRTSTDSPSLSKQKGIYVTTVGIVIYVLITICLATAVGLIVHFTHPGKNCRCDCRGDMPLTSTPSDPDPDVMWEKCLEMAKARDECLPAPPCGDTDPPDTPVLPTEPPRIEGLRLPATWTPSHYNIEIKPDIYADDPDDFSYEGWVQIYLTCTETTDNITLHYRKMDMTEWSVEMDDGTNSKITGTTDLDPDREFYILHLDRQMTVGDKVLVKISYNGQLWEDYDGMFWNAYYDNGQRKYAVLTQLESTDSRKTFPCLDEPHLKSYFNVTLWRKSHMKALSNTNITMVTDMGDEWWKVEFAQTPVPMTNYLVAFAVGDFEYIDDVADGGLSSKYMRYFAPTGAIGDGQADYIRGINSPMFDYLEELFNHTYDFPKLDSITINEFSSGAMENWGLATYRESRLLFDANYSTQYEKQRAAGTNAHELLHMWIGNVVTCSWWENIWLQETMARYYQHRALKVVELDWDIDQIFGAQVFYRALDSDSTGSSFPLYNPTVETPAEIGSMFNAISYDKGACVIRMMHELVMADSYDDAIREYIAHHAYQAVDHDDMLGHWDEHAASDKMLVSLPAGRTWTDVMYTWIKQMGYPVLTVTRSGDRFIVTQKMFLGDPEKPIIEQYPSQFDYKWDVPIAYIAETMTNHSVQWFTKDENSVTITVPGLGTNEWFLGNRDQRGYYRVNYDLDSWKVLTDALSDNTRRQKFTAIDRADLIDNSMKLARAAMLDQLVAMDTTRHLGDDDDFLPWYAADRGLTYLDIMLRYWSQYGDFRAYLREIIKPQYDRLGWTFNDTEPIVQNYLRVLILDMACQFGIQDCVDQTKSFYDQWRKTPADNSILLPEIRQIVYCNGVHYGHSDLWDELLTIYGDNWHSGPDANERIRMRNALTCSNNRWVLERYFRMADTSDPLIFPKDRSSIMILIARTPLGLSVAWDYLNQNWDTMAYRMSILDNTASRFSTDFDLDKLEKFYTDHPPTTVSDANRYDDIRFTVEANIRWRKANEKKLAAWLTDNITIP